MPVPTRDIRERAKPLSGADAPFGARGRRGTSVSNAIGTPTRSEAARASSRPTSRLSASPTFGRSDRRSRRSSSGPKQPKPSAAIGPCTALRRCEEAHALTERRARVRRRNTHALDDCHGRRRDCANELRAAAFDAAVERGADRVLLPTYSQRKLAASSKASAPDVARAGAVLGHPAVPGVAQIKRLPAMSATAFVAATRCARLVRKLAIRYAFIRFPLPIPASAAKLVRRLPTLAFNANDCYAARRLGPVGGDANDRTRFERGTRCPTDPLAHLPDVLHVRDDHRRGRQRDSEDHRRVRAQLDGGGRVSICEHGRHRRRRPAARVPRRSHRPQAHDRPRPRALRCKLAARCRQPRIRRVRAHCCDRGARHQRVQDRRARADRRRHRHRRLRTRAS